MDRCDALGAIGRAVEIGHAHACRGQGPRRAGRSRPIDEFPSSMLLCSKSVVFGMRRYMRPHRLCDNPYQYRTSCAGFRTMPEPDLADLDAFVAVARARGFRTAAAMRGVSPSSLSEALRRLEATARRAPAQPHDAQRRRRPRPASGCWSGWCRRSARSAPRSTPSTLSATARPERCGSTWRQWSRALVLPSLVTRFLAQHPGIVAGGDGRRHLHRRSGGRLRRRRAL